MSLIYINSYAFGVALDPDAEAYITAVEGPSADNQALEPAVVTAINDFVVGCKADGIWSAIKASCILAGARTLAGALVPLVGSAPTNSNFVAGDYNRKTGLVGNAGNKNLSCNRNNNADPQNNFHMSAYASTFTSRVQYMMGSSDGNTGTSMFGRLTNDCFFRNRCSTRNDAAGAVAAGLIGTTRSTSSSFTARFGGNNTTFNTASQTPENRNIRLFTNDFLDSPTSDCRFAFYSIGENLDLALLDSRVATLLNDFGAAIS